MTNQNIADILNQQCPVSKEHPGFHWVVKGDKVTFDLDFDQQKFKNDKSVKIEIKNLSKQIDSIWHDGKHFIFKMSTNSRTKFNSIYELIKSVKSKLYNSN